MFYLSYMYILIPTPFLFGSEVWFEVDQEPLLDGCYLFSSNNLKEALDWCYDNLNIDLMYY